MIYYTIKEIADIVGVSKTAIQKTIKDIVINYDYIDKNKQYYSIDKTIEIIKAFRPCFDTSDLERKTDNSQTETANSETKTDNKTDNSETKTENTQTKSDNSQTETANSETPKEKEIETLNRLIDIINKQLEEKDKQLAIKDKQIADLSNRLAEALELTKGQQYLAVADKAKELQANNNIEINDNYDINNDNTIIDNDKKNKIGFFKKIFNFR